MPAGGLVSLLGEDPRTYRSHALHTSDRTYMEINCYTDILIELLHARGHEPMAVMGATVEVDFEGDQWTFFKPPPEDLTQLFGLDVHEMQPYRALEDQIAEQIANGRTLTVELDSWYLPDTAATSYHSEHVKSSIVAEAIDREEQLLRYFHATGLYELRGEDYRGAFRLGAGTGQEILPPYTELVRFDAGTALRGEQLRAAARELLRVRLQRRPQTNPFERFGAQLERELPLLLQGASDYHSYAFATVRMAGSAFEATASFVAWLLREDGALAHDALGRVVEGCKSLSFRLARRREFDPRPMIAEIAAAWDQAMVRLDDLSR